MAVTMLQDYMASIGYSANHVTDTLSLLVKRDCLEGQDEYRDRETETPVLGEDVRITSLGSFHITTLVRTFQYMDAVTVDTPILNEETRALIKDTETRAPITDSQRIRDRLKRARVITRYLDQQVEHLTDADARRVLSDIFAAVANDIMDIEQGLKTT